MIKLAQTDKNVYCQLTPTEFAVLTQNKGAADGGFVNLSWITDLVRTLDIDRTKLAELKERSQAMTSTIDAVLMIKDSPVEPIDPGVKG